MSWFDVNLALRRIRQFLHRWRALISNLNRNVRPSSVFECYSFIGVVEAYDSCRYNIQRGGPGQIIFKRSVRGIPNNYTFFIVTKQDEAYEIRLNQGYRNTSDIYFNLDITVSKGINSLYKRVLTAQNIHTFCECKHYKTFYPSTCANFIGLARIVMPRNILWKAWGIPNFHSYPPPALLVSGEASAEVYNMVSLVRRKKYHVRFLDNISPYGGTTVLGFWVIGTI